MASSSRSADGTDFPAQRIRVSASYAGGRLTTPKSGKVRSVPLAPAVAAMLVRLGQCEFWVAEDDLAFPGAFGSYLDASALSRRYKNEKDRLGGRSNPSIGRPPSDL